MLSPKQLRLEFKAAYRLLDGANCSYKTIHAAWVGFYRVRNYLPAESLFNVLNTVAIPNRLANYYSWASPWQDDGFYFHPYKGVLSATIVLQWAARGNLFPVFSEPSWRYVRNVLRGFKCEADL